MAKHYLSQLKGKWGLLVFGILGIVLLLYGGHSDGKTANVVGESYFDEAEAYRVSLEARLEELCASVAGVSSPDVFITLDSRICLKRQRSLRGFGRRRSFGLAQDATYLRGGGSMLRR